MNIFYKKITSALCDWGSTNVFANMMRQAKISGVIGMLLVSCQAHATVTMAENDKATKKKEIAEAKEMVEIKEKRKIYKKNKHERMELHGFVNKDYVRFIVDVTKDNAVSGQMFSAKGTNQYVYGELLDGVLYLYDRNGRFFTVVLSNN